MAVSQKFGEFNGDQDEWIIYKERLEQNFVANKVEDEKVKVATLLSVIGVQAYKLLRNLCHPNLPATKKFDELTALLEKQFTPQVNFWRERKKFYEARQEKKEAIADWHAKVRSLSVNCDFGNKLIAVLKDRFMSGLTNNAVFDRLCEEPDTK